MNKYAQRVEKIRELMRERGIGLYLIPMEDNHGSEYVSDHFRCIDYVSGFSGSAGNLIITMDGAWLYADGRYYVQAAKQLEGSGIELMKLAAPNVPDPDEFIAKQMSAIADSGLAFGFDGNVLTYGQGKKYIDRIASLCGIEPADVSVYTKCDLVGTIWEDRPAQLFTEGWIMDKCYCGEDTSEKISRFRQKIEEKIGSDKAYSYLLSSLDDIAWIFNLRGSDIPCNPICFAYAKITRDSAAVYLSKGACSDSVMKYLLSQGVQVGEYDTACLEQELDGIVIMDSNCISYATYSYYLSHKYTIRDIKSPSVLMKAMKNKTELSCAADALLRDSVNVTEFMCWLKERCKESNAYAPLYDEKGKRITELSVDEKLDEIRMRDPLYIDRSFTTIAAYKDNAAMMHYQAKPDDFKELNAEGMLLIDSGVQCKDGTTDITRTFILGPVDDEEKRAFTLTAMSMLRLMNAKFIYGCTGENLDIVAREPMWENGMDYKCGTGHGVGHVLNVHEGPHAIRWKISPDKYTGILEDGMVVTDEPGVYREGKFGIRIENELYVKEYCETSDGRFLCFEPMTYIPIDLDGIDINVMTETDRRLLNEYHQRIYEKLSPYLTEKTRIWLKMYTREV